MVVLVGGDAPRLPLLLWNLLTVLNNSDLNWHFYLCFCLINVLAKLFRFHDPRPDAAAQFDPVLDALGTA